MEAGIAAARLSQFKQLGGFKRPLEHFEAQKGLQPTLLRGGRQCRSDKGKERHRHKLRGHLGSPGCVHRSSVSSWTHSKELFMKASGKMLTSGLFPAESGITGAGQWAHSNRAICQTSRFQMEANGAEAQMHFARMKWPQCRNSCSNSFGGINHISPLTHSPHSHQGGCAGQAGFLLSSWHRLCEAPAWRLQPLFGAQQRSSNAKAAEVMEGYRFYSIVCSSAVSWYIKALLSFVASAGRRPVLCPFI